MTLTGGLRDRMLLESVLQAVTAELQSLGWLDAGRQHADIQIIDEYPDEETEVPINTLAVSFGGSYQRLIEMGSRAEEHTIPIFLDLYAESEGLGRHLIGDLYAFLASNPAIPVYDYDQATPTLDFYAIVEQDSLEKRRPGRVVNPWQKHWHILELTVSDVRTNT